MDGTIIYRRVYTYELRKLQEEWFSRWILSGESIKKVNIKMLPSYFVDRCMPGVFNQWPVAHCVGYQRPTQMINSLGPKELFFQLYRKFEA
jgi:hypothetical protein